MIGQSKIVNYINSKSRDTFPRSIILLGEKGCGKHTVLNMLSEKLCLQVVDITKNLNFEYIMELQQKPEPYIYVISANELTVKSQNAMLKFIEEPLKNSFIVVLAESQNQLLPTVYNRCQILNFVPYSKDELLNFSTDELVLSIAKTPGQVKSLIDSGDMNGMIELANKMITKIGTANIPNILTISDKIAFKNEKDKFDLELFANVFQYCIIKYIRENTVDKRYYEYYRLVSEWNNKRKASTVLQKPLFENYLLKFKNCLGEVR